MYQIELYQPASGLNWIFSIQPIDIKQELQTSVTMSEVGLVTDPFFLMEFKSQYTKKIKRFNPSLVYGLQSGVDITERYFWFFLRITWALDDDPSLGYVKVGTIEFPYGFYDFKVYEMSSAGDYDPRNALGTLFEGTMNLSQQGTFKEPVNYKEYTNNDADTESIYITNPL